MKQILQREIMSEYVRIELNYKKNVDGRLDALELKDAGFDTTIQRLESEHESLKKQNEFIGTINGSSITTSSVLISALETEAAKQSGHPRQGDLINVSGGAFDSQQWYRNATTWVFYSRVDLPAGLRVMHLSTVEPTSSDGNNGDLWFVYE